MINEIYTNLIILGHLLCEYNLCMSNASEQWSIFTLPDTAVGGISEKLNLKKKVRKLSVKFPLR